MLDTIIASTHRRVADLAPRAASLRAMAASAAPVRSMAAALAVPGLQVIAEIKRRSPSAGDLAPGLDAAQQAKTYQAGGAAAISVLTEPEFFAGSLDDLRTVRTATDLPILRKDFVVDELQLFEARAAGADAVLLIVAALGEVRLRSLLESAQAVGLEVLVEVHDAAEAAMANRCGATVVGVNNRDLKTFVTDLATAESLAGAIDATVRVAESGVATADGAARMAAAGYDAILVGEALVRAADAALLLSELRHPQ